MSWTERNLPALSYPQYRLLFSGTTLAQLAFGMMMVVQGIVAFDLTGKNSAVGLVALGSGLSMLFLGPIGGTLSDRMSKRRLLMATQVVIGSMFAIIGVMIVTGVITIWLLALSTLTMGAMFAVMGPTRQAWIGDLLEGDHLSNGVALNQLMMNATRIVGPLAAGGMVALAAIGTGGTYLIMAGLFVVVLFMLGRMEEPPPNEKEGRKSMLGDLTDGARYIWGEPQLRLFTFVFVGIVLSGYSYMTLLPGFLENEIGQTTKVLGLVYGVSAVGGIATTLALTLRPAPRDPAVPMFFCGGVLAMSLLLLSFAPNFLSVLGVALLLGASSSGFQLLNNINLMERTRHEYFGRVMSVTLMAFGVNSICAFPIGTIADHTGERFTFMGLSIICFCVVAAGFSATRTRAYRGTMGVHAEL